MSRVLASAPGAAVVVGLGNFVGLGDELVRYWEQRGEPLMTVETLLIGLVLALLWAEITDISPGGIIVPGTSPFTSTSRSAWRRRWPSPC